MIKRVIYKPKVKRLFDLDGGVCYLEMRGSIYFLKSTKYNSIELLRKVSNYESKTPTEFWAIIHDNYIKECEKTRKTEIKKQAYYKKRRLIRKREKIENLKAEIKQLEAEQK